MKTYRITFPNRYPETSPGYSSSDARQGYYTRALTESDALNQVKARVISAGNWRNNDCMEVDRNYNNSNE